MSKQTHSSSALADRILRFARVMDYALVIFCALAALYYVEQAHYVLASLWLFSAGVSFLVAHFHVARKVTHALLLRRPHSR